MKRFFIFILIFLCFGLPVFASTTLYQKTNTSKISSGVNLINYKRFTDSGWLNINVLEVNLKDKYTNLGIIYSSNGVGTLQNLLTMANNANSIAAINGDFFQAKSGKGNSVGLAINDNEIISSSYYGNEEKDEFATFALDKKNNVYAEYFTNTINLTSQKNKKSIEIDEINKYPRYYENGVIYTPAWGTCSVGSVDGISLTEMVIKNNKIVEIRNNGEPVEIPKNGYVVSAYGALADYINDNFKKGTKVNLDINYNVDINKISLAISGGAVLVKNGEIPETFASNITGRNPRTAIGISKDEKTIYLVTVDGRQKSSIGMTQTELAEFLKEINVYNAINLDGGGSTTMVGRKLGDNFLSVINTPSDGSLRSVINGVAVYNNAPSSSKVTSLVIEIDDTNIIKGIENKITVKGFNKYSNPVEIKQKDIKWSYDGVPAEVKNDVLYCDAVGSTVLTAKLGSVKTSVEINIIENEEKLEELQKHADLENEDSFRIAVVNTLSDSRLMINNLKNNKIKEIVNDNSDVSVFTSATNNNLLNNIDAEIINCNGYSKNDFRNSTFITIDCNNEGIRATDSTAWIKVQDDIKQSNSDNIFIIMNNYLDNFSDKDEANLWIEILAELQKETSKNIWIIHSGDCINFEEKQGVKHICINDVTNPNEIPNNAKYILITVNDKNLTYEIKNVFE